ncbi:hypothetical protein D3C76_1685550 [compost metagenome]
MPAPPKMLRNKGTITLRPIKPYTTDGIPDNNSMAGCNIFFPLPGTISVIKSAAHKLSGLAIKAASRVVVKEPVMNGNAP